MYIGAMDDARLEGARERLHREEAELTAHREQELRRAKSRERIRQTLRNQVQEDEEREPGSMWDDEGLSRRGEDASAVDKLDDQQASEELRKEKREAQDFLSMMDSFRRLLDAPLPSMTGEYSDDFDEGVPHQGEAEPQESKVRLEGTYIFNGQMIRDGKVVGNLGADGDLLGSDGQVIGKSPNGHHGIRTQISRVPSARSRSVSKVVDDEETF
jgi:hypothetical protein